MTKQRALTRFGALAGVAALSVTLAGCGPDGSGTPGDESKGTVVLGFIPSWTDGLATAYLLEDQLGKLGYEVEMEELTEPGPLYAGLSEGDVDIYPSAWPEVTHAAYMDEFGASIEDLGAYYDNAKLTITVPAYVDIDSIADLKGNADRFGGRIVGIEPGAGLTAVTQDAMMPAYELDGEYELVTSSTIAMLAELESAIESEQDIVVTLWRPFWPYGTFDLKDLEDPLGAMGEPEALHFLGTDGFAAEHADAAELIAGIHLDDVAYGALESAVVAASEDGTEAEAVDAWIAEFSDAFPTLITE